MDKLCIGIPTYGTQPPEWSIPLMRHIYELKRQNIELISPYIIDASSMAADYNRNDIVARFLNTDAEWLMWVDADNTPPMGSFRRLLDTGKKLVTGIYVGRNEEARPIAYLQRADGSYENLSGWTRGEIIPIDSAGMGALLSHRSVYEDIRKEYRAMFRSSGGITAIHKDDISGDVFDNVTNENDGKVIDGVLHERLYMHRGKINFPFFGLEFGRTEDYWFYERAKRAGHELWLDTSVEVGHIMVAQNKPEHFRARKKAGK